MDDPIIKGEKVNIYCGAWDDHTGGIVTISSAVFEVFDAGHNSVQTSGEATIVDNGTVRPDVYGLVDTTQDAFTSGGYYVLFTVIIGTETLKKHNWFTLTGVPVPEAILSEFTTLDSRYVNAAGDSMAGALTLPDAPTADLHASTKKYVDDGLDEKKDLEEVATPQLESISGSVYRDASYARYTVSDDGITRIHDLVNDPIRDCIWGVTRSETAVNYVFKMDRDGTVTKTALGGAGEKKAMFIAWGGDYLWVAILSDTGQLVRVNPDTMALTTYDLPEADSAASCLTYSDGYIFVGTFQDAGTEAKIFKFDISAETFVKYTVSDVYAVYWALFDGTYSWFAGEGPVSGTAVLVKMAVDGTYSTYDLGANTSGAEITYDGTYIWHGSNAGVNKNLIRFNPGDDSVDVLVMPFPPRLLGFDGEILWLVATTTSYARMDTKGFLVEVPTTLAGCTYSHGLTFDGLNAWIGTWQDTCYIYRIPMLPISAQAYPILVLGGNGTLATDEVKYASESGLSATENVTQIPIPHHNLEVVSFSANILSNTLNKSIGIRMRKNGEDIGNYITVPAGETGVHSKTPAAGSVTFTTDDLLSVRAWASEDAEGSVTVGKITVEYKV